MATKAQINAAEKIEKQINKMIEYLKGSSGEVKEVPVYKAQFDIMVKAWRRDNEILDDLSLVESRLRTKIRIV